MGLDDAARGMGLGFAMLNEANVSSVYPGLWADLVAEMLVCSQ